MKCKMYKKNTYIEINQKRIPLIAKRCVLSSVLNWVMLLQSRKCAGKSFHRLGAAITKERSPNVLYDLKLGWPNNKLSLDLKPYLDGVLTTIRSFM